MKAILLIGALALSAPGLRAEETPMPAEVATPAPQVQDEAPRTTVGTFVERALRSSTVHGYVTADYQGGLLINDAAGKNKIIPSFEQYRFIFGVQSELAEKIVFNSEVEFEHATRVGVKTNATTVDVDGNSATSADKTAVLTSASAGLEIEIEQGWVEFRHKPWLRPRVGVVLVPLGRLNLYHDSDMVDTVDRPLSDQQIIGTTWFEPGLGFTGELEIGESMLLSYQGFAINGLRGTVKSAGDESKLRDLRMHKDSANDNNTDKGLVGRIAFSPLSGIELAASGYRGAYDADGALFINYAAFDGLLKWRGIELEGEWVEMATDLPDQSKILSGEISTLATGYFKKSDPLTTPFAGLRGGWWAQLLVQIPVDGVGRFEPFVNVSQIDPNKEIVTANDQTRFTYGLNYRPSDNIVVKLNYADTQYVKGYTASNGSLSTVLDQRLSAALAAAY